MAVTDEARKFIPCSMRIAMEGQICRLVLGEAAGLGFPHRKLARRHGWMMLTGSLRFCTISRASCWEWLCLTRLQPTTSTPTGSMHELPGQLETLFWECCMPDALQYFAASCCAGALASKAHVTAWNMHEREVLRPCSLYDPGLPDGATPAGTVNSAEPSTQVSMVIMPTHHRFTPPQRYALTFRGAQQRGACDTFGCMKQCSIFPANTCRVQLTPNIQKCHIAPIPRSQ